MTQSVFRIHPAIGFARVGNAEEFYLAPESLTGLPDPDAPGLTGGLPIKAGTENEPIAASDLRAQSGPDRGKLKRQAARFRIYAYDEAAARSYPSGAGTEIAIGSVVDGKTVADIIWTVHVANKKGNSFVLEVPGYDGAIINLYDDGRTPPLRNVPSEAGQSALTVNVPNINDPARIAAWTTDPGPRSVKGRSHPKVCFDAATEASAGGVPYPHYPKLFPAGDRHWVSPADGAIDTLGSIETDEKGRLIVLGGYGHACARRGKGGTVPPLDQAVDNDGWFDDTSDGPVTATLVFTDGTTADAGQAWVVTADPAFAPQILNTVSLWDDIYDTFIRELDLQPEIYTRDRGYNPGYRAAFSLDVQPFFKAADLQQWIANLPIGARKAHAAVGAITAADKPAETILAGLAFIRDPNQPTQSEVGPPLMPLSLGDSGMAFLSPSYTQYFFLTQWNDGRFDPGPAVPPGKGETLDRAALMACLGGRFSPGIDLTFTVRQPDVWVRDWRAAGPFRIAARPMDYSRVQRGVPFLTGGYVPQNTGYGTVEPGDMTKFMSIPWHTDYNSCATHPTQPAIRNISTLYWSWPAQRPVNVFVAREAGSDGRLGPQRYSVRGPGTGAENPADQGRYQQYPDMLDNWHRIGAVIEGPAIDTVPGRTFPAGIYLEAEGQLTDAVAPWPTNDSQVEKTIA